MSIVADHYQFIVGVDTHAATHTYAIVESPSGKLRGAGKLSDYEPWFGTRSSLDWAPHRRGYRKRPRFSRVHRLLRSGYG